MRVNLRINVVDFIWLFSIVIIIEVLNCVFLPASAVYTYCLCILCLFVTIYGFVMLSKKTGSIINPYNFFWLSLCVFSVGQAYVYLFDQNYDGFFLFSVYSLDVINNCLEYALLSFVMVLAAGFRTIKGKKLTVQSNRDSNCLSETDRLVFFTFWIISAPFYFMNIVNAVSATTRSGYGALYTIDSYGILSMWFIPTSFALIIYYKNSIIKFLFLAMLFVPIVFYLLVGTRSVPFAIILSIIWLWHSCIKKFSRRFILFSFFGGVACLVLMAVVGQMRTFTGNLSDYFLIFSSDSILGFVEDAIAEMGGSMQIWLRLQHIVPQQVPYMMGLSYLASVLSCIPSFILGGFSFAEYAHLSGWITEIENESYGLGFSLLGETYCNFGWLGVLLIFFLARFIFFMLGGCVKEGSRYSKYIGYISVSSLMFFATLARSSLYLCVRQIVYCIILPILVSELLEQFVHARRLKN